MREMRRIRTGIRRMGWVRSAENQCGDARNLGENTRNVGNQGGDEGNQVRNLSIAVEITWNSNGNDIVNDWREVKMINLVSGI